MRSWGRGFTSAVDPYRDNGPDEDGDVCCLECGGVFPGLDELRAAGLSAYPRRCRECRAEERADPAGGGGVSLAVPGAWNAAQRGGGSVAPGTTR